MQRLIEEYPNHFSATRLPDMFEVEDFDSFLAQVYLIKAILDSANIAGYDIQKISKVSTSEKYTHQIPTNGFRYVFWGIDECFDRSSLSEYYAPFPINMIKSRMPKEDLWLLAKYQRLWEEPREGMLDVLAKIETTGVDFESTGSVLLHEYFRLNHVANLCDFNPTNGEYLNILERLLLTLANEPIDGDAIFSAAKLKDNHPAVKKMFGELADKRLPRSLGTRILADSRTWLKTKNNVTNVRVQFINKIFKLTPNVGKVFVYAFPDNLLIKLLRRGSAEQLACVCLRYACILQQAQQWANSDVFYNILVNDLGASIEGFASPLNTRILLQSDTAQFCSLFPDVDAPFGSIGSFFEQDYTGKTISVCPPYTGQIFDQILATTKEQIESAIQNKTTIRMIFGIADWPDIPLVEFLERSEHTKYKKIVKRGDYAFFDTKTGSAIVTSFSNRYYVIDIGNDTTNYKKMFDDYFEKIRDFAKELTNDMRGIVSKNHGMFDLDTVYDKMTPFDSRFVANQLIYKHIIPDTIQKMRCNIHNYEVLFGRLLADAFMCVETRDSLRYSEAQVEKFIKTQLDKFR